MTLNLNKTVLLKKAMDAFHGATGIYLDVAEHEHVFGNNTEVLVRLKAHGCEKEYEVEIKRGNLGNAEIGAIAHKQEKYIQKRLLVTQYVNPNMADRLKEMNIQFIDATGNAYINEPPIFIFAKGNKLKEKLQAQQLTRAFQPTGLKVLFTLLCKPEMINTPYRNIAKAATVALGTVGWVINDLKELGYLVDMGARGRKLVNKEKLLERWVTAYPEKLRPKQIVGKYTTRDFGWWKNTQPNKFEAYWGGEVAAAKITKYLKPEVATVYIEKDASKFLLRNKLKKDPNGNVELLKTFWDFNDPFEIDMVPPLLVYADLLATGDARNIETAKIIYEQKLTGLIGKD